jgi:hypothetical protein
LLFIKRSQKSRVISTSFLKEIILCHKKFSLSLSTYLSLSSLTIFLPLSLFLSVSLLTSSLSLPLCLPPYFPSFPLSLSVSLSASLSLISINCFNFLSFLNYYLSLCLLNNSSVICQKKHPPHHTHTHTSTHIA